MFVIPPSHFLIDDRTFPFLGPLQVAATAREVGYEVSVIDLTGFKRRNPSIKQPSFDIVFDEAWNVLLDNITDKRPDIIGFYSLAAQHPFVVKMNMKVKSLDMEIITALGGPHANTASARCIKDGFDYVVVSDQGGGGGEPGLLALLDKVKLLKEPINDVRNDGKVGLKVCCRDVNTDRIISVPSRIGTMWENDRWPLPARDLIDLDSYVYHIAGERATSLVSAAGCPFACTYCSHWGGYRKLEAKSSKRVGQEIDSIRDLYGLRAFMFYDDEINLRPDFSDDFLLMLRSRNILWRAFFKCGKNLMHDDVFEMMAASGCAQLCTGAESADPKILKDIRKGATREDNTRFVKLCVKYGIKPKVFTQVGLPGDNHDTVKALRDWLVEMAAEGLSDADVTITTPYEGTPIFDTPEKFDIQFDKAKLDFSNDTVLYKGVPGEYKSHVRTSKLSADDIVIARDWVEREFRSAANLPDLVGKDDG